MNPEMIEYEASSGNVFDDLGFPDAEEQLRKALLTRVIRKVIRERGLTQAKAAALIGITPPDLSALMRGRLARFGRERLERCLVALDREVRIPVSSPLEGNARADRES